MPFYYLAIFTLSFMPQKDIKLKIGHFENEYESKNNPQKFYGTTRDGRA